MPLRGIQFNRSFVWGHSAVFIHCYSQNVTHDTLYSYIAYIIINIILVIIRITAIPGK